ncbi:MAG: M42 family metallopeptidase [Anaerolineales bacterium]
MTELPSLSLLEKLCNACAVSGDEGAVRQIVLEEIRTHADEINVDAIGNVLAVKHGQGDAPRKRVMVTAHMDEVGFMLIDKGKDGLFRFDIAGGIDVRVLPGKAVWVGKERTPGVIGARPIHLTSASERSRAMSVDELRIDVGPQGKANAGDWAVFATSFEQIGPSLRAKALDDRLGVAILITLLKNAPANIDLLAAFTVQEEVGLRGAEAAAHTLNPDLAIAVDCTPAYDQPSWDDEENTQYNTRLGYGPAIYVADRRTISNPALVRHFTAVAEAEKIPYQYRQPGGGSTDAGGIFHRRTGIPVISLSTPGRYLHTPLSIARLDDWHNTYRLLHAALGRMNAE